MSRSVQLAAGRRRHPQQRDERVAVRRRRLETTMTSASKRSASARSCGQAAGVVGGRARRASCGSTMPAPRARAQRGGGGPRAVEVGVGERRRVVVRRLDRLDRGPCRRPLSLGPSVPPTERSPSRTVDTWRGVADVSGGRAAALVWCPHRSTRKRHRWHRRRYLNFDLLLEQEGEGRYQARVTDSPWARPRASASSCRSTRRRWRTCCSSWIRAAPAPAAWARPASSRRPWTSAARCTRRCSPATCALAWQRSLDRARAEQAGGLRLRLRLNDAPAIAGLPWELLYDAKTNSFLAQSERTPARPLPRRAAGAPADDRRRAAAGAGDHLLADRPRGARRRGRVAADRRGAGAARSTPGLVVLDRLPSATLGELGAWLRQHQTHVIHFVGHGDFDDRLREGVIYFQDQHGRSSPVTSSILGPYLRDHDPLRMVVLNACRSARTDAVDPFGGMAQGLVQQDATAVVAMQFPISDRAAVTFTGEFYGALVDGLPGRPGRQQRTQGAAGRVPRRVGDARAVHALARRQHLRERARRGGRRTVSPSPPHPSPRAGPPSRPGPRSGSRCALGEQRNGGSRRHVRWPSRPPRRRPGVAAAAGKRRLSARRRPYRRSDRRRPGRRLGRRPSPLPRQTHDRTTPTPRACPAGPSSPSTSCWCRPDPTSRTREHVPGRPGGRVRARRARRRLEQGPPSVPTGTPSPMRRTVSQRGRRIDVAAPDGRVHARCSRRRRPSA